MSALPSSLGALVALVFVLGMRHGFDADHLAAIDGMTRLATQRRARHARCCGVLFSLGHGAVVVAIALTVGVLSARWTVPTWLDAAGAWLSIGLLLLLGAANLHAAATTPRGSLVPLVGCRARLFGGGRGTGPWSVAATGALFALSFDTVSQAALFAATAARIGGPAHAALLGVVFLLGMVAVDGANGWWTARLMARADGAAAAASRVMSLAVAAVSLAVAGVGIARLASPRVERWGDGAGLLLGAVVVLAVVAGYGVAVSRRGAVTPAAAAAAARR